ncbi:MAG: helix-turn-helix domain-containing protein [Rikenellaceae bacterium]
MSRLRLKDEVYPTCPVRNVLSRIGDKWSLLVLFTLQEAGTVRFKDIQRMLPDISQKMLTVTLRTLEEDGFVLRVAYPVIPPKVEYSLTERANSLLPHINTLIMWAKENMDDIIADRSKRAV